MEDNKKHIDDIFRDGLDNHEVPLTEDDMLLFNERIDESAANTKPLINPKYAKWLPYLAALSAAASTIFLAPKLFNDMTDKPNNPIPAIEQIITNDKDTDIIDKSEDSLSYIKHTNKLSIQNTPSTVQLKPYNLPKYSKKEGIISLLDGINQTTLPVVVNSENTLKNYNNTLTPSYKTFLSDDDVTFDNSISTKPELILSLGYESGLATQRLSSIVISGYLRQSISSKLYIGVKPSFKYGATQSIFLPEKRVAYTMPVEDVQVTPSTMQPGLYDYFFTQYYDSITYTYEYNNKAWDIELPVQLEYSVLKNLSVTAGIKFTYGKLPEINRSVTVNNVINTDSTIGLPFFPINATGIFEDPSLNNTDLSVFENPEYNSLRTGYTLGVNFTPLTKLHINVSMHQNASDLSYIPNPEIRRVYNSPQLRFSLGYKVF